MEIRKISGKERLDASLISAFCFHMRVDDMEKFTAEAEKETVENWGAFLEDGTMAAHIINNKYSFFLDGTPVRAGGIGAVSTLPEYRSSGAIREIFRKLLPDAYRDGEVISALYPFSHAFYRKQGYETVTYQNNYNMRTLILSDYSFDGDVKMWKPGQPVTEYREIYQAFAREYNFALDRTEESMQEHIKTDNLWQERKFTYLLSKDGRNLAYVIFTDRQSEPGAALHVEETAWVGREGFLAVMGFLARFTADYEFVELPLPAGIDLMRIFHSPRGYELNKSSRFDFMVRVINAKKLLETIRKPADCDFVIQVSDELIAENNAVYHVTQSRVTEAPGAEPDLTVSVRALGQMAVGCVNLDEAMLRPDVQVNAKEELLRRVFIEKKIYCGEHF